MSLPEGVTNVIDGALSFIYSFEPLVEKTLVLVPDIVKDQTAVVADMVGMDIETTSYVLGMFVGYPLGMIMLNIPYGTPRHLFSFLLGAFLLQFTLGVQWIHQLISSLVAYAMILVLPRKTLKIALPIFAMLYLTLGHLHRQYINYLGWDLDFTGVQMVLTMKLYMIGFNLYDGELLEKGIEDRAAKKCAPFALKKTPTLLEFLGYTFCFCNLLAGPATEYSVYLRAIDGSVFDMPNGKRGTPPSNVWATIRPLLISLLNMGVFLTLGNAFPMLDPENPQKNTPYILTDSFMENPWPYRYLYCWLGLLAVRQKYYFGWKNAEGAQNIWYAGFDGFDENGKSKGFETASNVDIIKFELAPDVQRMSKFWNIKTSLWLTRYIYIRTGGSLLAVYATSAFWHGFYPGYYFFFLSIPLITFCDRLAKKKLSPYFPKEILTPYGIVGVILTTIYANYMVHGFVMLSAEWTWQAYKSHYFFGHITSLVFFAFLTALPKPKVDDKKAKTS